MSKLNLIIFGGVLLNWERINWDLNYYLFGLGFVLESTTSYFLYFASFIGMLFLLNFLFGMISFLNRQCLRGKQNFRKKYGLEDSWIVISGGSDGIGLEYCKAMAKEGFSICVVGRNEQKMKDALAEVMKTNTNKNAKQRIINADFSKMASVTDYEKIAAQTMDLDIAILFANAGWVQMGAYMDLSHSDVESMINVDCLQPIFLIKAILPQLIKREKKSAILVTSSSFGTFLAPGVTIYNASKAFATFLGQSLNYELRGKVDVLSYEAGRVGTKLLGKKANGGQIITPQLAAEKSLRDLGKERKTYGAMVHEITLELGKTFLPIKALGSLVYKQALERNEEQKAELQQNKKND